MGVIMQSFYWDSAKLENKEGEWWNFISSKIDSLGPQDLPQYGFLPQIKPQI